MSNDSDQSFEFQNGLLAAVNTNDTANPANSTVSSNDLTAHQPAKAPALLFSTEPNVEAVAIGNIVNASSLHGQRLKSSELCIQITEILKVDSEIVDSFEEPMQVGGYFAWKKSKVAMNLGNTEEAIKRRLPNFLNYVRNRQKQQTNYEKKRKLNDDIVVNSFVSLKIPRVDRSNTCKRRLPAKVIAINGNMVKLQCRVGIIEGKFRLDEVEKWNADIPLELQRAPDTTISLVGAYRSETNYSMTPSICKCVSGCKTQKCRCYKSRIGCATKCHPARDCNNLNENWPVEVETDN